MTISTCNTYPTAPQAVSISEQIETAISRKTEMSLMIQRSPFTPNAPVERDLKTAKIEQLSLLPLLAEQTPFDLQENILNTDLKNHSLYFGTGLCTPKLMSAGIPFDIVGLVATAEKIRKILGFGKVIQLIADTHAKTNQFESEEQVDKRAKEFKETLSNLIHNLGITETYQILLASEFDKSKEYMEIYESIHPEDIPESAQEYAKREWSDMEYLARTANTCLKLSWKVPVKPGKAHKFDETFFDKRYAQYFNRAYSFISNNAAVTFDPNKLNVCPYTCAPGDKRILIKADENAQEKLEEFTQNKHKAVKKALDTLEKTVDFFESTFNLKLPVESLGGKINKIQEEFFFRKQIPG